MLRQVAAVQAAYAVQTGRRSASKSLEYLDGLERQLEEGIAAQQQRIERIERLTKKAAPGKPWHAVSIVTSGIALMCAWRLYSEQKQHEARPPTCMFGRHRRRCSGLL